MVLLAPAPDFCPEGGCLTFPSRGGELPGAAWLAYAPDLCPEGSFHTSPSRFQELVVSAPLAPAFAGKPIEKEKNPKKCPEPKKISALVATVKINNISSLQIAPAEDTGMRT